MYNIKYNIISNCRLEIIHFLISNSVSNCLNFWCSNIRFLLIKISFYVYYIIFNYEFLRFNWSIVIWKYVISGAYDWPCD